MAIARNALFNLFGAGVPAALAVLTIPYVVRKLGVEDFGLLTLITAIVGYFAVLDVNVTAGSTKYVAEFKAVGDFRRVCQTISFGMAVYALIGTVGAVGLWWGADLLVRDVFGVAADRQALAASAVRIAAFGFFLGQMQAYLQSVPGALMRYDVSGQLEAAFGSGVTLLTVGLLAAGFGLLEVVVLRVAASGLQAIALLVSLRRLMPWFTPCWPDAYLRRRLLSFSAFAFLSRLAALTYSHADKLIIGNRMGTAAVAYYAVPGTLANRVMALVFRLSGVMLPHASALAANQEMDRLRSNYITGSRYLFYLNGLIAILLGVLAQPLLTLWVGEEFARQGALVLTLIAVAQWVDAMTNLPSLVNDGLGHARVSGTFAVTRAVLGLGLITLGVGMWGIEGAAAGHLLASVLMSAAFLMYVHGRTVPLPLSQLLSDAFATPILALTPVAVVLWWARVHVHDWLGFVCAGGAGLLLGLVLGIAVVLRPHHRVRLKGHFRQRAA